MKLKHCWRRTLGNWIYTRICCSLWKKGRPTLKTENEERYYHEGFNYGARLGTVNLLMAQGKEIHRLCHIIEKRNKKIRSLRETLKFNRL